MQTYISILRGINVSGKRIIKMADLVKLYQNLGFENVKTYIQSGNVVFQFKEVSRLELSILISNKIAEIYGFDVPVITLTQQEIIDVISNNILSENASFNSDYMHITFLSDLPLKEDIDKIQPENYLPDVFMIHGKVVYLYCPNGYGNTKLSNTFLEKKLKVIATTRNLKTVNELKKLSNF